MKRALARLVTGAAVMSVGVALYVPLDGNTAWQLGDLFVGVGSGQFQVRNNAGVFKEAIPAGGAGDTGGCGFDASLNAYLVNTTQFRIFRRALASPHQLLQTIDTDPNPQSIVFGGNGDFYVGHLGGLIRRYVFNAATGNFEAKESHQTSADTTDSFWIDMAADQRTLFYTSGGRNIRRVMVTIDAATNAAAFSNDALFTTLPPPNSNAARALRLLPPGAGAGNSAIIGGLVVADTGNVKLVNASGALVREYDAGSGSQAQNDWFAVALDITDVDEAGGDLAFWAGDKSSGNLWRFRVQSSVAVSGPVSTGAAGSLRGLCLNGEPTTGQNSVILTFDPASGPIIRTAVFAAGTPALEEHSFSIILEPDQVPTQLRAVVNAREAISDGACTGGPANTNDVDCGFATYFSTDPLLPRAAPYARGRSVFYRVRWLTPGANPLLVVQISSESSLGAIEAAVGTCTFTPSTASMPVTTPRALRILRDPSSTPEDQFAEDLTDSFYVDEWGTRTIRTNRFIVAARCATGTSVIVRPAPGRTFKAGNSIPIELNLTDAFGNPITSAITAPHSIASTVGFNGQVLFVLGTPGSSPTFFNQIQPGTYVANLQTTGLSPSSLPYNFCVSDRIEPLDAGEVPLFQQRCVAFFLK